MVLGAVEAIVVLRPGQITGSKCVEGYWENFFWDLASPAASLLDVGF
jgi:hypothetical protein